MKILIIAKSRHYDNTLKIAEAMCEAAPATLVNFDDVNNYKLDDYDIIGFGSGIYFGKHDKELMKFVAGLHNDNAYTFVFSTSGSKNFERNNASLINLLKSKNKVVLGSFGCLGLDKFFIFALGGGINKGKPDTDDFDAAQQFICEIVEKYQKIKAE